MPFLVEGIELTRRRPESVRGFRHLLAAFSYSLSGGRRLWQETAFRLELVLSILIVAVHLLLDNERLYLVVACLLILVTLAIEALNTAVEVIVDHISPDYSKMAKEAKDLGSFAVFCLLLGNGLFLLYAIIKAFTTP